MGYSGAQFDPEKVDLYFESAAGKMQIIKDGVAVDYSEEQVSGAAVFPVALRMVWQTASKVKIPVVGLGGITKWEDAVQMLLACLLYTSRCV